MEAQCRRSKTTPKPMHNRAKRPQINAERSKTTPNSCRTQQNDPQFMQDAAKRHQLPLSCRCPAAVLPPSCRCPAAVLPLPCRCPAANLPLSCRCLAAVLPLPCRCSCFWPFWVQFARLCIDLVSFRCVLHHCGVHSLENALTL